MSKEERVVSVPSELLEQASSCSEWARDAAITQLGMLVLDAEANTDEAYTRYGADEIGRLNTVVEQQKNLIASLRSELRESYSIDAAVQEEHLDLEAAAKKLAACMDYPWEHMPEQGCASMREHAKAIVSAALSASTEVQS